MGTSFRPVWGRCTRHVDCKGALAARVVELKWLVELYDGSELFWTVARQSSRCSGVSMIMSNCSRHTVSTISSELPRSLARSYLFSFALGIQRLVVPPLNTYDNL